MRQVARLATRAVGGSIAGNCRVMNTIDYTAAEALEPCPPEAVISGDLQCVGCGYNLRTM